MTAALADRPARRSLLPAAFGMLLKNSRYAAQMSFRMVYDLARENLGSDENGYRREFLELVRRAMELSGR